MNLKPTLTDQETALALYLDALFTPMREEAEARGQPASAPLGAATATATAPTAAPLPVLDIPPRAATQALPAASMVADTALTRESPPQTPGISAGFGGDCLVAEHQTLRLALPMQALAAILPAPEEYARLPGQAAWLHGVIRHRGHNVPVVSAYLLAARDERLSPAAKGRDAQVVVLGSGRWAVHIDHVTETRTVSPADCRLRPQRERLPWLAGYLTHGLVSLIDVAELEQWLDELSAGTEAAESTPSGR